MPKPRLQPGLSDHESDAPAARASRLIHVCLCVKIFTCSYYVYLFVGVLQLDIVRTLIEYGANVNARNQTGFTPLFWATGNSLTKLSDNKWYCNIAQVSIY